MDAVKFSYVALNNALWEWYDYYSWTSDYVTEGKDLVLRFARGAVTSEFRVNFNETFRSWDDRDTNEVDLFWLKLWDADVPALSGLKRSGRVYDDVYFSVDCE